MGSRTGGGGVTDIVVSGLCFGDALARFEPFRTVGVEISVLFVSLGEISSMVTFFRARLAAIVLEAGEEEVESALCCRVGSRPGKSGTGGTKMAFEELELDASVLLLKFEDEALLVLCAAVPAVPAVPTVPAVPGTE